MLSIHLERAFGDNCHFTTEVYKPDPRAVAWISPAVTKEEILDLLPETVEIEMQAISAGAFGASDQSKDADEIGHDDMI